MCKYIIQTLGIASYTRAILHKHAQSVYYDNGTYICTRIYAIIRKSTFCGCVLNNNNVHIYTYIYKHICSCMYKVYTCILIYSNIYINAQSAGMQIYIVCIYIHIYTYTYINARSAGMPNAQSAYIHIYINSYIYTHLHICIYI